MDQGISKMSPQQLVSFISSVKDTVALLKDKGEDLITTFLINKQLLDVVLEKSNHNTTYTLEAKKLMTKLKECDCSKLLQQQLLLSEEVLEYKNEIEDKQYTHEIEVHDLERKNSALAELWSDKEKQITLLRTKINNNRSKSSTQEKNILNPTKKTLLMHNELEVNKNVAKKFNKKMIKERKKQNILIDYNNKLKARNIQLKNILGSIINGHSTKGIEEVKAILEDDIEELTNIIITERLEKERRADTSINILAKTEEDISESHKITLDKSEAKRPLPKPTQNTIKQYILNLELIEKHPQPIEQNPPVRKKESEGEEIMQNICI